MAIRTRLILALSLLVGSMGISSLQAKEVMPWLGMDKQFEWRNSFSYTRFNQMATGGTKIPYAGNTYLYDSALSISPNYNWAAELEVTFAKTAERDFGPDGVSLTGRYLILDDIVGDPVSLVFSTSVIAPLCGSGLDPSRIYNGFLAIEPFLSIGKEFSVGSKWLARAWGMAGIGVPNSGSGFWESIACLEGHIPSQSLKGSLFWSKIAGFGSGSLPSDLSLFEGYSRIGYSSQAVGFSLTYEFEIYGQLSFIYEHGVQSRNCPYHPTTCQLQYLYPFGL